MRVISGSAKRTVLMTPEGENTRPTTDRIKETLFNMLQPSLYDAVFVDFFSGSGQIGIEALSRGASQCFFVEKDAEALNCIKQNLHKCHMEDHAVILRQDVSAAISGINCRHADIIFMDPPYDQDLEKKVLELLLHSSIIDSNTMIIIEASLITDFSYLDKLGYELIQEKKYKTNRHLFVQKKCEE